MPLVPQGHRACSQNWAEGRRWREWEREFACTFAAPNGSPESPEADRPPPAHRPPAAPLELPLGPSVARAEPFGIVADPSRAVPGSAVAYPAGTSIAALRFSVSFR